MSHVRAPGVTHGLRHARPTSARPAGAIDYDRRRVTVAGRAVTLTPTEYELLRALAQGAGRILTHEDLLRKVWAGRGHGKVKPKIVRAYVKRLRHRLGDDAARPVASSPRTNGTGLDRRRRAARMRAVSSVGENGLTT